jgi:predicted PurR-regulated permease PerM
LLAAPVLVAFIGWQHGWGWAGLALAGVLSMFRKPLAHVWLRLRGAPEERVE